MKTNQPIWKLAGTLGDINPVKYGGGRIYIDATGVYSPEVEYMEPLNDDENSKLNVWRFTLEPCTFINGVLSDNEFHPQCPAWFAKKMDDLAEYTGQTKIELIDNLLGNHLLSRAQVWLDIGQYFGMENLDSYPLLLTQAEAEEKLKTKCE